MLKLGPFEKSLSGDLAENKQWLVKTKKLRVTWYNLVDKEISRLSIFPRPNSPFFSFFLLCSFLSFFFLFFTVMVFQN